MSRKPHNKFVINKQSLYLQDQVFYQLLYRFKLYSTQLKLVMQKGNNPVVLIPNVETFFKWGSGLKSLGEGGGGRT